MRCEVCGQLLESDARYCGECGASVAPQEFTARVDIGHTPRAFRLPDLIEATEGPPDAARRHVRTFFVAFVLWTLGIAALGATAGYGAWDRWSPHSAGPVTIQRPSTLLVQGADDETLVMPDVVSLSRQAALEAIASAGLDPSRVSVTSRPNAAPVGTVVAQEPLGGTSSPTKVALIVAGPARMPRTVGTAADAATVVLEGLGAVVQTRQVYAPGVPVGTVARSVPPAGKPVRGVATLFVSSAPSALFLSDLTAARLDCSTGSAAVSGKDYASSVLCSPGTGSSAVGTWVLDRHADGLSFAAGLTSDSDPAGTGSIVIRADGRAIKSIRVRFGAAHALTLPLKRVTQLTIEVTGSDGATVVLGDAELLGSASGMNALQARS